MAPTRGWSPSGDGPGYRGEVDERYDEPLRDRDGRGRHPGEGHDVVMEELCLTWPVIQRLGDALTASGRIRLDPGSDWIRMPLEGTNDGRLLLLLMSVAIKAHRR